MCSQNYKEKAIMKKKQNPGNTDYVIFNSTVYLYDRKFARTC